MPSLVGSEMCIRDSVLVFYLCDVQIENMRVRFEKEKLEQLNVYQNRQLKLMHQMDEELRIQRHDFQQHISMLAFMNSQGEKEKLTAYLLSLIHISEPTRLGMISYAVFCLKKKKKQHTINQIIEL